ncbi:hypothetical protein DUNSADRAFT_15373 [Dunaliella salina]|uniref:Secreted protein n=1 Tax=Dunaliella salina TaxID=3046 RepID=A0ABQ7H1V3_DUNSA|nr:hypothetical protein DUNSADRAFT_15373 [Dunaliella salina]|eukprot:KAF5840831.1 hypothetical protein DUNSADRAFT_15373 [Dunaliella salina]
MPLLFSRRLGQTLWIGSCLVCMTRIGSYMPRTLHQQMLGNRALGWLCLQQFSVLIFCMCIWTHSACNVFGCAVINGCLGSKRMSF